MRQTPLFYSICKILIWFDSHHLLSATSDAKGQKKRTDASLLARGSIFLPFDSATARARNKCAAFMSAGIACFHLFLCLFVFYRSLYEVVLLCTVRFPSPAPKPLFYPNGSLWYNIVGNIHIRKIKKGRIQKPCIQSI